MNHGSTAMSGAGADEGTERRANELYWSSGHSVNQIAEELDLSKGMLYGLIRPLPSGLACPACGEEAVYPNRTAKERTLLACPTCGWEGDELETEGAAAPASVTLPGGEGPREAPTPAPPADGRGHRRALLGGALLGAAAGLALVIWTRRR